MKKKGDDTNMPPLCNIITQWTPSNRRGQTPSLAALDPSSLHSHGHLLQPAEEASFNVKKSIRRKGPDKRTLSPRHGSTHRCFCSTHTDSNKNVLPCGGGPLGCDHSLPTYYMSHTNKQKQTWEESASNHKCDHLLGTVLCLQELRWTKVVSPHGIRPLFHPPRKTRTSQ